MISDSYIIMLPLSFMLLSISLIMLTIHFVEWSIVTNTELRFHLVVLLVMITQYVFYIKTKG